MLSKPERYKEIGEKLRQERLKMGYDVELVSRTLKLNSTYLKMLENGQNIESLMNTIYLDGYIKSYSRFLGFSTEEIMGFVNNGTKIDLQNISGVTNQDKIEVDYVKKLIVLFISIVLCFYMLWQCSQDASVSRQVSKVMKERKVLKQKYDSKI